MLVSLLVIGRALLLINVDPLRFLYPGSDTEELVTSLSPIHLDGGMSESRIARIVRVCECERNSQHGILNAVGILEVRVFEHSFVFKFGILVVVIDVFCDDLEPGALRDFFQDDGRNFPGSRVLGNVFGIPIAPEVPDVGMKR